MTATATLAKRVLGEDLLDGLRAREETREAGTGADVVREITEHREVGPPPELVADLIPARELLEILEKTTGYDSFIQALWMAAEVLPAERLVPLCSEPGVARSAISFLISHERTKTHPRLAWATWCDRADRSQDMGLAAWCVRCGVREPELLDTLVRGLDGSVDIEPDLDVEREVLSALDALLRYEEVTPGARHAVARLLERPWLVVSAAASSAAVATMQRECAIEHIRQARDELANQPLFDGLPRRILELAYAASLWRLDDEPDRQKSQLAAALAGGGPLERFEALRRLPAVARERDDALMVLLQQLDAAPAADVLRALGCVGPAATPAVPLLRQLVQGGKGELKIEAVLALGAIIGPEAATSIPPARLSDPGIRRQLRYEGLLFWLRAGVDEAHRPHVAELLQRTDDPIRVSTAIAEDPRRARRFLPELLLHAHPEGVATAWRTLGAEFWRRVRRPT